MYLPSFDSSECWGKERRVARFHFCDRSPPRIYTQNNQDPRKIHEQAGDSSSATTKRNVNKKGWGIYKIMKAVCSRTSTSSATTRRNMNKKWRGISTIIKAAVVYPLKQQSRVFNRSWHGSPPTLWAAHRDIYFYWYQEMIYGSENVAKLKPNETRPLKLIDVQLCDKGQSLRSRRGLLVKTNEVFFIGDWSVLIMPYAGLPLLQRKRLDFGNVDRICDIFQNKR